MSLRKMKTDVLLLPVADTEYPYEFPDNVERFRIQLRDPSIAWRMNELSGVVASPGANDKYINFPADSVWEEDLLDQPETKTFYFASPGTSMVLEIMFWTGIIRRS